MLIIVFTGYNSENNQSMVTIMMMTKMNFIEKIMIIKQNKIIKCLQSFGLGSTPPNFLGNVQIQEE